MGVLNALLRHILSVVHANGVAFTTVQADATDAASTSVGLRMPAPDAKLIHPGRYRASCTSPGRPCTASLPAVPPLPRHGRAFVAPVQRGGPCWLVL